MNDESYEQFLSRFIDGHYAASALWLFVKQDSCGYDPEPHTRVAHKLLCGPFALVAA